MLFRSGGESKTIEGLPTGTGYIVTEADAEGFEPAPDSVATGTIEKDAAARAEFTNTRRTGDLTLSKELVSDAAADADQEFTFTVTLDGLSGEAQDKTYGDVEFKGGVATVALKGGQTATATGLPTGISYIVEETANNAFDTTKTGYRGTISDAERSEEHNV